MAIITNQASLSYGGVTRLSNVTTGELVEPLTITKTTVDDNYQSGDTVTYVITLVNTGGTNITGLTVTDDMGGYVYGGNTVYPLTYVPDSVRYYIGGAPQADPTVAAGPPMRFESITVPAGGNTTLVYQAAVNQFAPLDVGDSIINTVADEAATVQANNTLPVEEAPNLTVSKTMTPGIVTENGVVTYTFTIQNTGNTATTAPDSVILSDTFVPQLSGVSVLYNGTTPWTNGTEYSYDPTTGAFATTAGAITVPAATYTRGADGSVIVTPGSATVAVTGTV